LISVRRANRLGLLFAAATFLAGVSSAYDVVARKSEQQGYSWIDAFAYEVVPRVGLGLVLAVAVYFLVHAVGAFLSRLDQIASAAQAATRVIPRDLTPLFPTDP